MTSLAWEDTITLYLHTEGGYTRQVIENCFWDDSFTTSEKKQGTNIDYSVMLFIPYIEGLEIPGGSDRNAPYIVKGVSEFEFESDDISQIRAFETANKGNFWRPQDVANLKYGTPSMWHIEVKL